MRIAFAVLVILFALSSDLGVNPYPFAVKDFRLNESPSILSVQGSMPSRQCVPGEYLRAEALVHNLSKNWIPTNAKASSVGTLNLSYQIVDADGKIEVQDGERFSLPEALRPSSAVRVPIVLECPKKEGPKKFRIELVHEGIAWQHDVADPTFWSELSMQVLDDEAADRLSQSEVPSDVQAFLADKEGADAVTRAYKLAKRMLKGQVRWVEYRGQQYPTYFAGSSYPMLWVRDLATIQRAYNILNDARPYPHWLDFFAAKQSSFGEIPDWVQVRGDDPQAWGSDKNDVQTDQELWYVIASLEGVEAGAIKLSDSVGPWSNRQTSLLEAIDWLVKNRWNKEHRCLTSGHVADWGDVGLQGADGPTSTKLAQGKPLVCGIFLQSLFLQALNKAEASFSLPLAGKLAPWGGKAYFESSIRDFASKAWNGTFFRIHTHLEDHVHSFDEGEIFALGGNVLASESGLASVDQVKKLVETARNRQLKYKISTIGATLLPPYPLGAFTNPIMRSPFEYQNGGQWDWFGSRMAYLSFSQDAGEGWRRLSEISRKVLANHGFYEWESKDGAPHGSAEFKAGAAAFVFSLHQIAKNAVNAYLKNGEG